MSKTETELAGKAQQCGLQLVHEPGKSYWLRTWEGGELGPFSAGSLRTWLAGYSHGMNAHRPGCSCGRVACNRRNKVLGQGRVSP